MTMNNKEYWRQKNKNRKHLASLKKEVLYPPTEKLKMDQDKGSPQPDPVAGLFAQQYCKYSTPEGECLYSGVCCKDAIKSMSEKEVCQKCHRLKEKGKNCIYCDSDLPF